MSTDPQADALPGRSRAELAQLAQAARGGVPIPWDTTSHASRCSVCRSPDLEALEAGYLAWTPTAELAKLYDLDRHAIRAHAAAFLWDLVRCGETAPALSQLVEAGVEAAITGQATPETALAALRQLRQGAAGRADPSARDQGTTQILPAGDGAQVITYEEKVRRVQAQLSAGADPQAVVAQLAGRGDLPDPLEADELPVDNNAAELSPVEPAAQLPDDSQVSQLERAKARAAALLAGNDGTRQTRERAARRVVSDATGGEGGLPR